MSYRAISNAGFNLHDKVSDVVANGSWLWPTAWYDTFTVLINVPTPSLNNEQPDTLHWRMRGGSFKLFFVRDAWHSVRDQGNEVWFCVLQVVDIQFASNKWDDIMAWLSPISDRNNVIIIVARLVLAAISYCVWQERNNRVHGKSEEFRTADQ
nr:hypothetical protein [Tanacetum cinerariifolium]